MEITHGGKNLIQNLDRARLPGLKNRLRRKLVSPECDLFRSRRGHAELRTAVPHTARKHNLFQRRMRSKYMPQPKQKSTLIGLSILPGRIAAVMPRYIYVVVTCKTPRCGNVCALKYLGVHEGQLEIGEMVPTAFVYECGVCHRHHRYELSETRTELLDSPPPAGWKNGWES